MLKRNYCLLEKKKNSFLLHYPEIGNSNWQLNMMNFGLYEQFVKDLNIDLNKMNV